MAYWLMKSEPDVYSIDDLAAETEQTDHWDGIRNYQARNFMRDMKLGEQAFFYHSNCKQPGIVGIMEIARTAYPDHTAFDPMEHYFDAKGDPDNPRWMMVNVKFVRKFKRNVTLTELKADVSLAEMRLVQRGNRLSIMPLSDDQWHYILELE